MSSLLPVELIEMQLDIIDMCQSLYPLEDELVPSSPTFEALPHLRSQLSDGIADSSKIPSELAFTLNLMVEDDGTTEQADDSVRRRFPISLSVELPLRHAPGQEVNPLQPPLPLINLRQPPWLSRSAHSQLAQDLQSSLDASQPATAVEFIMAAVDAVKHLASRVIPREAVLEVAKNRDEEWRVWFVLVSLSSRSKRNDMLSYAKSYDVTGYVLAGKPAALTLEGTSKNIDAYMNAIKSESWADIPSFQKKVSERYRERLDPVTNPRVFNDMQEITDLITRGGHRGNRGDMGEVRDWLTERGLGEAFGLTLGNGSFT